MKDSEKKGFLGRLFGRKEEKGKEEAVKPPDSGHAKLPKAKEPELGETGADKTTTGETSRPPATSDAVELEMDIPEEEFATVAISASDLILEADVKEEPSESDAAGEESAAEDELTDVTSQVIARRYGFPEYAEENKIVDKKDVPEYVLKETLEIKDADPELPGLRETVPIDLEETTEPRADDRPETKDTLPVQLSEMGEIAPSDLPAQETGLGEAESFASRNLKESESESALAGDEIVAETPEAPLGPSGIKDVAHVPAEQPAQAFGLEKPATVLAQFIESCQTPFNAAIHGEEGCGKTTFMKMTALRLADSNVIPLWLNVSDYCLPASPDRLPVILTSFLIKEIEKAGDKSGIESNPRVLETMQLLNDSVESLETLPRLRIALQDLVSAALESGGKSKIVIFIDDLDRLDPVRAIELLECLSRFLRLKGIVFVMACSLDIVKRGLTKNLGPQYDELRVESFFHKVFQLSLDVGAMEFDAKGYLREVLERAHLQTDDKVLDKFLALLKTSVGVNPRKIKGLVNDLAFLEGLRPANTPEGEFPAEETTRYVVRFGILCLRTAFTDVYGHLLAIVVDESVCTDLLEETLRSERGVLELDSAHPLFHEDVPKQDTVERLVGFVDLLLDGLDEGSRHKKLTRQEREVIQEEIQLANLTGFSRQAAPVHDRAKSTIREFCRTVKRRIARVIPDLAPDASNGDLRNWPSDGPWFALWYSDKGVKRAWERGHVFFELSFRGANWNTIEISLKCNTVKAFKVGVEKKAVEDLTILPILEEEDFEYQDHRNGWVEITKELRLSRIDADQEISEDDIENVVEELRDLIESTHEMFDVALPTKQVSASREPTGSSAGPSCKTCGSPLERVRLKDGSISYRCRPCGKIYRVKGVLNRGA